MGLTRREFLKGAGTTALVGAAAATFWSDVKGIRDTEDYREAIKQIPIMPRRPIPSEPAKVYWVPGTGSGSGRSWPEKVTNAFYAAGLDECFDSGDVVCVKVHCGERHRDAYLRPGLIRAVVQQIKKCGGDPFVMDTLVWYGALSSSRMTVRNMEMTARMHGWTPEVFGCPVYAYGAGGRGDDHVAVAIDGNQVEMTYVDRLLAQSDALIVLTHLKGHGSGMMGGSIKNMGIGGGSIHGKMADHDTSLSGYFRRTKQVSCEPWNCVGTANCPAMNNVYVQGDCMRTCSQKAFTVDENGMTSWHPEKCEVCRLSRCTSLRGWGCSANFRDITAGTGPARPESSANLQIRYADLAVSAIWLFPDDKVGYINVMKDVCRVCDCASYDDIPIVPHLGVLAGKDIVAIDQASLDMVTASDVVPTSRAEALGLGPGDEKFEPCNGQSPLFQIVAANNLGAGTREYDLIEVPQTPRFAWNAAPFYLWDLSDPHANWKFPPEKDVDDPRAFFWKEGLPKPT